MPTPQGFNLTQRAKEDLHSIWLYTFKVWDETQADLYITQIYSRFQWLSEQPSIGKRRTDICKDYYCFPQGSHLVFYIIQNNRISIIGVPHKDMDVLNYFDSED